MELAYFKKHLQVSKTILLNAALHETFTPLSNIDQFFWNYSEFTVIIRPLSQITSVFTNGSLVHSLFLVDQ